MKEPFPGATAPVSPVAPWQGGKRFLARRIVARIHAISHDAYVEPFVGMGGVFLRRPFRAKSEVINDVSRDVATLFRVLQRHYQAFLDMLRWQLAGRAEFARLLATNPDTLTDLERAARFLYLQRLAFGGRVTKQSFGVLYDRPSRFDMTKLASQLEEVHERLAGVTIEALPWAELLRRYDRPGTLFYLDPPYYSCERDYGDGLFGRDEFAAMAEQLRGLRGTFILSLNDHPEVRRLFDGMAIEAVQTTYSLAGHSGPHERVGEVLITPAAR